MARKGLVAAALIAGATTYLSKQQNRDKTMRFLKQAQSKISLMFAAKQAGIEDTFKEFAETAASVDETKMRENNMIGEGGSQTALHYYNEKYQQQDVVH